MDKIECAEMTRLLLGYLNNALTGEETRETLSHLALCACCRDEAAFLIALKNIAGALAAEIPENIVKNAFNKIDGFPDGCEREDAACGAVPGAKRRDVFAAFGLVRDALYTARKTVRFACQSI